MTTTRDLYAPSPRRRDVYESGPEVYMRIALARDRVAAQCDLGLSLAQVIQQALRLAHDSDVATAHPELTRRVIERLRHVRGNRPSFPRS